MGSGGPGDEKDPCKWFKVISVKFYPLQDDHIQTIRFKMVSNSQGVLQNKQGY